MRPPNPQHQGEGAWSASAAILAPGWHQVDDEGQDGDLLALQFQPEQAPRGMGLHVRVRAEPSQPVGAWLEAGYHVLGYEGSDLGPGVQCVAEQQSQMAGASITCLAAYYRFAAGQESVLVAVEPTLRELFALAFTGLHELLGTLQVRRPDGSQFRALPVPGHTLDTADTWAEVAAGAEQGSHDGERSTDDDGH